MRKEHQDRLGIIDLRRRGGATVFGIFGNQNMPNPGAKVTSMARASSLRDCIAELGSAWGRRGASLPVIPSHCHFRGFTTGHLAQCPGATSTNGGRAVAHSGTRKSQRVSKGHPGGMACNDGTVPSMVSSGRARFVLSVGTALRSPRV